MSHFMVELVLLYCVHPLDFTILNFTNNKYLKNKILNLRSRFSAGLVQLTILNALLRNFLK